MNAIDTYNDTVSEALRVYLGTIEGVEDQAVIEEAEATYIRATEMAQKRHNRIMDQADKAATYAGRAAKQAALDGGAATTTALDIGVSVYNLTYDHIVGEDVPS